MKKIQTHIYEHICTLKRSRINQKNIQTGQKKIEESLKKIRSQHRSKMRKKKKRHCEKPKCLRIMEISLALPIYSLISFRNQQAPLFLQMGPLQFQNQTSLFHHLQISGGKKQSTKKCKDKREQVFQIKGRAGTRTQETQIRKGKFFLFLENLLHILLD